MRRAPQRETMRHHSTTIVTTLFACCLLCASPIAAQTNDALAETNYFYRGLSYGSDAAFHPVSELINGAFGVLQISSRWVPLDDIDWHQGLDITWQSISHPVRTVDAYGRTAFVKDELVPARFGWSNLQYVPNYTLALHRRRGAQPCVRGVVRRARVRCSRGVGVRHHHRARLRGGSGRALRQESADGRSSCGHVGVRPARRLPLYERRRLAVLFAHAQHVHLVGPADVQPGREHVRERGPELRLPFLLQSNQLASACFRTGA